MQELMLDFHSATYNSVMNSGPFHRLAASLDLIEDSDWKAKILSIKRGF
jgi:hypothetical protein